ncbi:hypothetical protein HPP92_027435 [Vanilla planifolia]|uniref:Uncharacterized protein n=1 Tax=Vanilla planifolia TaxID=51239 RepID=A0A835PCW4_VANPL|nr:hypothetical protein HPP92_027435 [Vanilla planifolia]KAG0449223.1 hypothetical protein HPP92_027462 [Vanilla planifolia]
MAQYHDSNNREVSSESLYHDKFEDTLSKLFDGEIEAAYIAPLDMSDDRELALSA